MKGHRKLDPTYHIKDTKRDILSHPGRENKIPKRFDSYFNEDQDVRVGKIRRYFRAIGKPDQIREKRLRELIRLYKKRIAKQFPHHKDQLEAWLSREGVRLASEKLHLYPLFFEDWVFHLVQKAMRSKA